MARLTITLDRRIAPYIDAYAKEWGCNKATAARTLIYDGVKWNGAKKQS